MENQNLIKIEIIGIERTNMNGDKYFTYRCKTKKGNLVSIKFTRNVTPPPSFPHGYIWVNEGDIELSETGRFPTFWVNNVVEMAEVEIERKSVADMF